MNRGTLSWVTEGVERQVEADLIKKGCKAVKKAPGRQMKCNKATLFEGSKDLIAILAQNVPDTSSIGSVFRCLFLPYRSVTNSLP